MNVLVIGNGGREHCLAVCLERSKQVETVFVSPGNGGTEGSDNIRNLQINLTPPFAEVIEFCRTNAIGLVVVGPENYLVDGMVDALQPIVPVFGPDQYGAQLEGSKVFAKEMMQLAGVKTAPYQVVKSYDEACAAIKERPLDYVLKADGLCAGKGVVVPETEEESEEALKEFFVEEKFGDAGTTLVIEEKLMGKEVSILGFCDGETVRVLNPSQDHKRIYEGDKGPNTGGMGVYSPVSFLSEDEVKTIEQTVFRPILKVMGEQGHPYKGILYAGLMVGELINVIEFNVRFGDPECQCVLPLLESDLVEVMLACIEGRLDEINFQCRKAPSVTVIMASEGYPGKYTTGHPITGLKELNSEDTIVFHAGTSREKGEIHTAGGRVLAVTSVGHGGEGLQTVINRCYNSLEKIHFSKAYYRRDIGKKGL